MAQDGLDLRKHLCSPLLHSCTGLYGPAPFGLKCLLLLPRYYTMLTLLLALTHYLLSQKRDVTWTVSLRDP
jgi:hypothetical protein